ncbi:protein kinase [Pendulispora rubella]|uniref:Protein kinase n=1 Tax=Pendulispora rubella TaxID=2741070 RepID=A0ABZ2KZ57_9BACT
MNSPEQGSQGLVGQTIAGRYNVIRVLGEGGMGVVYVGEQKLGATTRKVAIKTLHPHLSHDPKILARFERECGTIAELQHPNTIQVYDFGKTDDGTLYIVMEYVEGKSVAEVLEKEGPMAPTRVEKILSQVVGSLEEAHAHDIVHRDLKPENVVLCDRAGQKDWVEVLDFGIAKRQKEEDSEERKLTQAGMVLGTPPYMSPEQFTGRPIDARSDIYSLGIMAYEMLTGRLPFNGNTAYEWATAHMVQPPAPIETQPMGQRVPQPMRDAVQRALSKDPAQRFATVSEFFSAFSGKAPSQPAIAYAQTAALGAQQAPAPGFDARPAGGYGGTAPGVSAGYVTGPTPGYNTGDVPQRRGTEIGAQVDMPGYGPPPGGAPQYGPPPNQGYAPPPQQPVAAYHPAPPSGTESGGGARKGLIIGGLVAALAVCGVAVAAGMGAFSGGSKGAENNEPLFPSASTAATTPPPQPTETQTAAPTNTAPPVSGSLPPLNQERPQPPRQQPTTSTRRDAGTTTGTPTGTPTPQQPLPVPPPYQPPPQQPQPPPVQPPPQQPGKPGEPAECAAARTWCARAATDPRAVPFCNSKTAACRSMGGSL